MLTIIPTGLPGNVHETSPGNPARVTGSHLYRLSWAGVIDAADPAFPDLTGVFPASYRPAGTFGVAGLESQEHSVLWTGDPGVITRFRDDPRHVVPWGGFHAAGVFGDRWPNTDGWLDLIPAATWNPDGQGIVTEHDFDGGQVIVYEALGRPALLSAAGGPEPQGPVPVVTYHCTRCHSEASASDRIMSASPDDRRLAGLRARQHMLPGVCRGAEHTAWGDRMVAVVEEYAAGRVVHSERAGLYAARCQTREVRPEDFSSASSCAEVRAARTHTARHG